MNKKEKITEEKARLAKQEVAEKKLLKLKL